MGLGKSSVTSEREFGFSSDDWICGRSPDRPKYSQLFTKGLLVPDSPPSQEALQLLVPTSRVNYTICLKIVGQDLRLREFG